MLLRLLAWLPFLRRLSLLISTALALRHPWAVFVVVLLALVLWWWLPPPWGTLVDATLLTLVVVVRLLHARAAVRAFLRRLRGRRK